jgi:7-cyano-7-deazaguanine synthase
VKIVTSLSGGMDSATLAYLARYDILEKDGKFEYGSLIALSFDYGQRHRRELAAAIDIAQELGIEHHIIGLRVNVAAEPGAMSAPLASILGGSALTDDSVPVPEGHYADESMKATVVPNRNAIFLSIAYGVAVARDAGQVWFGAHAGDHAIYPDCREAFVELLDDALQLGSKWDDSTEVPQVVGPFLNFTKTDIARLGARLGVPFELTWSCYKGGEKHCGRCSTCVERREAFRDSGIADPTQYEVGLDESMQIGGISR